MTVTGHGIFFDGRRPRGTDVAFALDADRLALTRLDGTSLLVWPRADLKRLPVNAGHMRLTARNAGDARLEVSDSGAVAALTAVLNDLRDGSRMTFRSALTIGLLLTGAVISVAIAVLVGLPAVAAQLAPIVPTSFETAIGEGVRPQILTLLGHGTAAGCASPAGRAALDKATGPLIAAAQSPLPVHIDVVNVRVPNAFALPGGSIIVLSGMLDKVAGPEEFIGVIAHELGHVHNRDAMRQLIESAGLSAIISAVIGDYTGSAMSVIVGRSLISASFSRDIEANADTFAIQLMTAIGHNPAALGTALAHMTAGLNDPLASAPWLASHPSTPERVARLAAAGTNGRPQPILDAEEWAALKAICK